MKKLLTMFLALTLALVLVACGGKAEGPRINNTPEPSDTQENDKGQSDGAETEDKESGPEQNNTGDMDTASGDVDDDVNVPVEGEGYSQEELEALFAAAFEDPDKILDIPLEYLDLYNEYFSAQQEKRIAEILAGLQTSAEPSTETQSDPSSSTSSEEDSFKLVDQPVYIAKDNVKAYKEHNTSSEVLKSLDKCEMACRVGIGENNVSGWSKVILNGGILAYIKTDDLSLTKPSSQTTEQTPEQPQQQTTPPKQQNTPPSQQTTPPQQQTTPPKQQGVPSQLYTGKTYLDAMHEQNTYKSGTKVWVLADCHLNAEPDSFSEDVYIARAGETFTLLSDAVYGYSFNGEKITCNWVCYKVQLPDGTIGYINYTLIVDFDITKPTPNIDNTQHNIDYYKSQGYTVENDPVRGYIMHPASVPTLSISVGTDTMKYSYLYTDKNGETFCGKVYYPPYNSEESIKRLTDTAKFTEENRHTDWASGGQDIADAYDRLTGGQG